MTRAEDLLQALEGLRKAAALELDLRVRETASRHIKSLFQLAGFDGEESGEEESGAFPAFAEAIGAVRTQAEGELSGSAFQQASGILDALAAMAPQQRFEAAALASAVVASPAEPRLPAPEPDVPARFDALSAAAKARVEEAAKNLGVEVHHHHAPLVRVALHHEDKEPQSRPARQPVPEPSGLGLEALSTAAKARVDESAKRLGLEIHHHHAPLPLVKDHHEKHEQDPEPAPQSPPEPFGPGFDTLSAASKARVEEAASALGLATVHHHASPLLHAPRMPQEEEHASQWEKRSSEPCAMPEIEPIEEAAASEEASVIVVETQSAPEVADAARDFGSPANVVSQVIEYSEVRPAAPQPAPEPVLAIVSEAVAPPQPQEPASAKPILPTQASAYRTAENAAVSPGSPGEDPIPQQKTLFGLWLDMLFGRKK